MSTETDTARRNRTIDPILTEVIYNQVLGAAEEMGSTLARTAYSPNIKQRFDFSTAVIGADGEILAQAPRIPIHLGSMLGAVQQLLVTRKLSDIKPGDMFLANDPYTGGGQHLPDINVIAPVFVDGEPVAFVANIAHHADVGGMVAGSEAIACKNIFQEGLRLPPVQVVRGGEIVEDIFSIITLNSRTPEERRGDLLGQIAANRVGLRRVEACFAKYGKETASRALTDYLSATETRFRTVLDAIPDGEYFAEDCLDPDAAGNTDAPVPVCLKLQKKGADLYLDFTGTAPELQSARNVPLGALHSTIYCVVKMLLDPQLPSNGGFFRAIHVTAPSGCVLNPSPGAAVGARSLACAVVGDLVSHTISAMVPERALSGCGPHHQVIFAGRSKADGRFWVNYETFAGAQGARPYKDGLDGVRVHASGASNFPVEVLEQTFPLRIERYAINEGSGGKGRYRGGDGVVRDYRALQDMTITLAAERQEVPAPGRGGGDAGAPGRFVLNPGTAGEKRLLSALNEYDMREGDILSIRTPGAGGYGPAAKG